MKFPPKISFHLFAALLCCSVLLQPLPAQIPADTAFQQTAMELYLRGAEAERSGNITLAETIYLDLLKQANENKAVSFQTTANHRLAVLKAREKKYPESEKYFREAYPFCENNVSFLCDYAKIYLDQKRFTDAEPLLKSAVLSATHDRKILYNLGCAVASQEGRQTEGLRYLKLSLGEKEAYSELAKIYHQQGKESEAAFALQRAEQVAANQPIPQITEDIQEQLKKEMSFYESKRAVSQLNRKAQQDEEAENQKNKIKPLPDLEIASAKTQKVQLLPSSENVRFLPADSSKNSTAAENTANMGIKNGDLKNIPINTPVQTAEKKQEPALLVIKNPVKPPKKEIEPALIRIEVPRQPAVVQLIPPPSVVAAEKPQPKNENPPSVANLSLQQESRYEFTKTDNENIAPPKKPEDEPIMTFRPKNDASVNTGFNTLRHSPPTEDEAKPFPMTLRQWNSSMPLMNFDTAKAEKPEVTPVIKPEPSFAAHWQEPDIPHLIYGKPPAEVPAVETTVETSASKVIETAVVPVERKLPVFERPLIESPKQNEAPLVAWAHPAVQVPIVNPVIESAKEPEAVKPLESVPVLPKPAEHPSSQQTFAAVPVPIPKTIPQNPLQNQLNPVVPEPVKPESEKVKQEIAEIKITKPVIPVVPEPKKEIANVPKPVNPKPVKEPIPVLKMQPEVPPVERVTLPVVAEKPPVITEKPTAVAEIPPVITEKSLPAVKEMVIERPKEELQVAAAPPMPVIQNNKRTPTISMMSEAEFDQSLLHIQAANERAVQEDLPPGFARTSKNVLIADAAPEVLSHQMEEVPDMSGGFARSSMFAQTPKTAIISKQNGRRTSDVVEEQPVMQQEFRQLFFWNYEPQQKRKW